MKFNLIKTDHILKAIDDNLTSDTMTIITSDLIYQIEQYPFSNILLIPINLIDKVTHYISNLQKSGLFIRKDQFSN